MAIKNPNNITDQIYAIVRLIPYGKVSTYGAIAKAIGSPKGARIVGWAMNNSHADPTIPAHRVVNRNGMLTGKMHFATIYTMQALLEAEGLVVIDDCIQNFEQHFWDPISLIDMID